MEDNKTANQKSYQKAAKAGLCGSCRKAKRSKGMSTCVDCWFKLVALRTFGDSKRWEELRDLLISQAFSCAYTKRKLTIGKNASIEHIQPKSRFAKRAGDIKNLRWIDIEVNLMKRNLTMHEFLMFCKQVLSNFGYEVLKK